MDIRKVKKLIELLESSDIAEIEIKEGEEAVRISRVSKHAPAPIHTYAAPMAAPAPVAAAPVAAAAAAPEADSKKLSGNVIKSPMVGRSTARHHRPRPCSWKWDSTSR